MTASGGGLFHFKLAALFLGRHAIHDVFRTLVHLDVVLLGLFFAAAHFLRLVG